MRPRGLALAAAWTAFGLPGAAVWGIIAALATSSAAVGACVAAARAAAIPLIGAVCAASGRVDDEEEGAGAADGRRDGDGKTR